jgi:hypothetical protein
VLQRFSGNNKRRIATKTQRHEIAQKRIKKQAEKYRLISQLHRLISHPFLFAFYLPTLEQFKAKGHATNYYSFNFILFFVRPEYSRPGKTI